MSRILDIQFIQWTALSVSLTLAILLLLINVPRTEYAKKLIRAKTTIATSVNTYDVVNADKLILSVDAAKKLEEVLG